MNGAESPELTIRPSGATYRRSVGIAAVGVGPLLVLSLLRSRAEQVVLTIGLVTAVVCLLGLWLFFRNSRVVLDRRHLSHTNWLGSARRWTTADVGHVLVAEQLMEYGKAAPSLFVLDKEGARLIRLRGQYWSLNDMSTLARRFGSRSEIIEVPVTAARIGRDHPNAVGWWEVHQWLFVLGLVGALFACAMLAATVLEHYLPGGPQ